MQGQTGRQERQLQHQSGEEIGRQQEPAKNKNSTNAGTIIQPFQAYEQCSTSIEYHLVSKMSYYMRLFPDILNKPMVKERAKQFVAEIA
jgi:hypothetical protein